MLNSLRIQNFKSWQDTGDIQFGSITGFFGTNSSGKTSILQFLLMLKQTVESSDRAQVLNLGDERSYVELGTMHDILHYHDNSKFLKFAFQYKYYTPTMGGDIMSKNASFSSKIDYEKDRIHLDYFIHEEETATYHPGYWSGSMNRESNNYDSKYQLNIKETQHIIPTKPSIQKPYKFYIYPNEAHAVYSEYYYLEDAVFRFEDFFDTIHYLGPLREYPNRLYLWSGEQPDGVGNSGERAIAALLASRQQEPTIEISEDEPKRTVEQHVAYWLKELGLIHSFEVRPIAPNRKEYEVRIKRTAESAEVFLTDVGFGVSQLLPVLVLLFYVPEGSTIILEQPEIHLHPAVQAGLADVFIDAIKRRNVQIILESHSEHLLQRLQRRLAEEALPTDQVKLYFTDFVGAASTLTPLDLDEYGNIRNWPKNFFGDSFADASAMMEAELKRREAAGE